jgi:hypothetical protein
MCAESLTLPRAAFDFPPIPLLQTCIYAETGTANKFRKKPFFEYPLYFG